MLRRLQRDGDARKPAKLTRPHAGAIHHVLGLDVTVRGRHARDHPAPRQDAGHGDALDHPRSLLARALCERHGHPDRVRAPILPHVEAGLQVVGARHGEQLADLPRGNLLHVDAAVAVEGRDPPVFLQPIVIRRCFDEADRLETR